MKYWNMYLISVLYSLILILVMLIYARRKSEVTRYEDLIIALLISLVPFFNIVISSLCLKCDVEEDVYKWWKSPISKKGIKIWKLSK